MKSRNTMSVRSYMLKHLYGICLLWSFFLMHLFRCLMPVKNGIYLTVARSMTVLLALIVICGILSFFVTVRCYRNSAYLILNVLFPYGIYLALETLPYPPLYLQCVTGICFAVTAYHTYTVFRHSQNKKLSTLVMTAFRFAYVIFLLALAAFVFLCSIASVFGRSVPSQNQATSYDPDAISEEKMDDNYEILCCLKTAKWKTLTNTKKVEVLQTVADIETTYLGLPDKVLIVAADNMGDTVLGSYNHLERRIYININHPQMGDADECLDTVLHEAYHSYQHYLCSAYENVAAPYRKLMNLRDAAQYEEEYTHYTDGKTSYEMYKNQKVERDARAYAFARAVIYSIYINEE